LLRRSRSGLGGLPRFFFAPFNCYLAPDFLYRITGTTI
jgi:hypothetical protein